MAGLRSLLFNVYLYLVTVLIAVGGSPALLLPRPATFHVTRFWAIAVNAGLRVICNIHVEIRGREHLPASGGVLIASKHQSMWDTLIFFNLLPDIVYVLKRELSFIPFFGWYTIRGGMIRVDRAGHAGALRDLVKQARARIAEGRSIMIFPEGTRSEPGQKLDYKPGIAAMYGQLDVACVPVALNSGVFWPRRKFLRRPGTIVLEFLPPIGPGLKRRQFMQTLENSVETASARLLAETVPNPMQ